MQFYRALSHGTFQFLTVGVKGMTGQKTCLLVLVRYKGILKSMLPKLTLPTVKHTS